jgi:hypothetical protein
MRAEALASQTQTRELTLEYGVAAQGQLDLLLSDLKAFDQGTHQELLSLVHNHSLSIYQLKFLMGYLAGHLEDYVSQCEDYFNYEQSIGGGGRMLQEEFERAGQLRRKPTFEIVINSNLFFQKLGRFKEVMAMFEGGGLSFRKEIQDAKRNRGALCLKKGKNPEGYKRVKEALAIFKAI